VRRFCCLVVAFAALAMPATAAATGTYTSVSGNAKGSNGYTISWQAWTAHLGSSPVFLNVTFFKGGGVFGGATYWAQSHTFSFTLGKKALKMNKKLKKGSLKASLGANGKVSMKFTGKGKLSVAKPPKTCLSGPNTISGTLRAKGSLSMNPTGLGKSGKLKRTAHGSRYSSNKGFNCPGGGGGGGGCNVVNGQESMNGSVYPAPAGTNYISLFVSRGKANGLVNETVSVSQPLTAPGTAVNRNLTANGPASSLSQTGGVATLKGVGHGFSGTVTLTGTVVSNPVGGCAGFTSDAIFGGTVGDALTATLSSGALVFGSATPGLTLNWLLYRT
jgi:hypothetical protein